jgi:hypothetical protein
MSAFISYSHEDIETYETLCLALKGEGLPYWKPETMEAGESLTDQLREAINRCDVCIFLATRHSVESKWCLAEVGAFWGAGKRVIVFLVGSGIDQGKIPPQFQSDLSTSHVEEVIRAARSRITDAAERRKQELTAKPKLVSEMTIEELYEVLASLRNRPSESLPLDEIMRLIKERVSNNSPDAETVMRPLVSQLISAPKEVLQTSAQRHWQLPFVLTTDTGEWLGYSNSPLSYADVHGYNNCLLLLCEGGRCIAAIVVNSVWKNPGAINHGNIIVKCGAVGIGEPKQLSP